MQRLVSAIVLILCGIAAPAFAGDAGDRTLGSDMNRDRAQNRIERLREDKRDADKARAEKRDVPDKTKKAKSPKTD